MSSFNLRAFDIGTGGHAFDDEFQNETGLFTTPRPRENDLIHGDNKPSSLPPSAKPAPPAVKPTSDGAEGDIDNIATDDAAYDNGGNTEGEIDNAVGDPSIIGYVKVVSGPRRTNGEYVYKRQVMPITPAFNTDYAELLLSATASHANDFGNSFNFSKDKPEEVSNKNKNKNISVLNEYIPTDYTDIRVDVNKPPKPTVGGKSNKTVSNKRKRRVTRKRRRNMRRP